MEIGIGQELFDVFYPIGTYYETDNVDFNPNTNDNWFGEWVEDTKGLILVALDVDQEEFDTINKKGGSKYIQEHNHQQWSYSWKESDDIQPGSNGAHRGLTWAFDDRTSGVKDIKTGNSGNLQPYVVVKRWHRIA